MLSVTDISAFERFLGGALEGKGNPFDISSVQAFNSQAAQPSVAHPVELNFTENAL